MFPEASARISRRRMLQLSGLAAAAPAMAKVALTAPPATAETINGREATSFRDPGPGFILEATIADLQPMMASGQLSSRALVDAYLSRIDAIDRGGPGLNSIIELNPDARHIAGALDDERAHGHVRGPLHGIPVLVKDNIDTADRMQTAAGSLALVGRPALTDSTTAARLRSAGAVILGKTTLSEWANFRGASSTSGWSGRGGQCNNPYAIDLNPCGSSSGSGAATSANLTTVSVGTETDGSIVCPAHLNGVVGIKPTVGLTSRAGVVPISDHQRAGRIGLRSAGRDLVHGAGVQRTGPHQVGIGIRARHPGPATPAIFPRSAVRHAWRTQPQRTATAAGQDRGYAPPQLITENAPLAA
jgi:amidase